MFKKSGHWALFKSSLIHLTFVGPCIVIYFYSKTNQILWLLASKQPQNLYDIYMMLYVKSFTPYEGGKKMSKSCRVLFQNT